MPAKSPRELANLTVRFPMPLYDWLQAEAKERQEYLNDLVGRILEDARSCYGLPAEIMAVLEADRKALHKGSLRDYIVSLLVRRYDQLKEEQRGAAPAAAPAASVASKKR